MYVDVYRLSSVYMEPSVVPLTVCDERCIVLSSFAQSILRIIGSHLTKIRTHTYQSVQKHKHISFLSLSLSHLCIAHSILLGAYQLTHSHTYTYENVHDDFCTRYFHKSVDVLKNHLHLTFSISISIVKLYHPFDVLI